MNKAQYFKICISCITAFYIFGFLTNPELYSLAGGIPDTVNLIFHEAGHWIFYILGETISVLMGSGTEILIPCICAIHLYITNQKYSSYFTLYWLTTALVDVAVYIDDAIDMNLPLLGGDSTNHDWNVLLSKFNLLSHTHGIANICFFFAYLTFATAIFGTIYTTYRNID